MNFKYDKPFEYDINNENFISLIKRQFKYRIGVLESYQFV